MDAGHSYGYVSHSFAHPTDDLYWKLMCAFLLCVFILLLHVYILYVLQCRTSYCWCVCVCVSWSDINGINTVSFSNLLFLTHYYVFEIYLY